MEGKLFIDGDGDLCIEGRENNLIACAARDDCLGQYRPLNPDVMQEIVQRWNVHDVLTSEVTRLRAELANAGAVMVETCAQAAYDRTPVKHMGGTLAAHCTGKSIEDAIRTLSTLSPIAAAAGLVADAIEADMNKFNSCLNEEPATGETKVGHFFARVIRRYARALAEQEKAE